MKWQVYPNPSVTGLFTLSYQAAEGERVQLPIYNTTGILVRQQEIRGNGFIQQAPIDLRRSSAAGIYLLQVKSADKKFPVKLIKQ